MKRKIMLFIVAAMLSVSVAACGTSEDTDRIKYGQEEDIDDTDDDDTDDDDDDNDESNNDVDDEDIYSKTDSKDSKYVVDIVNSTLTVFDDNYIEQFTYSFNDYYREYYPDFRGYYDGYVYFSTYMGDTGKYRWSRIDTFTREETVVDEFTSSFVLDIVDGQLYVTQCIYNDDGNEFVCNLYEEDGDGYKTTPVYEDLCKSLKGKKQNYSYLHGIAYAMDNAGIYVVYDGDDNRILGYGEDGELVCQFTRENTEKVVVAYDHDYMIVTYTEAETAKNGIEVIEYINDGNWEIIAGDKFLTNHFVGLEDGILFYSVVDSSEYGIDKTALYAHTLSSGANSLIDSCSNVAGMTYDYNSTYGSFTVFDGNTCAFISSELERVGVAGDEVFRQWYIAKEDNGKWKSEGTRIVTKMFPVFDIAGDVLYFSDGKKCEYCNDFGIRVYTECFQLNDNYNNADSINKLMKETMKENHKCYLSNFPEVDESECEFAHNKYYYGANSNTIELVDAKIVKDKYVSVKYYGYVYYTGAAHGMPYYLSYIYNMETGRQVEFEDIYKGTKEEYYEAVGQAAFDKYDYYADTEMAFLDSGETFKQETIECLKRGEEVIVFHEDHIEVIFPPYSLGAFAMGMPSFDVSYDDLNMDF